MHTIQQQGEQWAVGFELPAERGYRNFRVIYLFDTVSIAACWASWLNGGASPTATRRMEGTL